MERYTKFKNVGDDDSVNDDEGNDESDDDDEGNDKSDDDDEVNDDSVNDDEGNDDSDDGVPDAWMNPRWLKNYTVGALRALKGLKREHYSGKNIAKDKKFWVEFGKVNGVSREWWQIFQAWENIRNRQSKDGTKAKRRQQDAKKHAERHAVYDEMMHTKGLVEQSSHWHKHNVELLTGSDTEFGQKLRDPDAIAHVFAHKFDENATENYNAASSTKASGFRLKSGKRLTNAIWNSYRIPDGVLHLGDWKGKDWQLSESAAITHLRSLGIELINQRNGSAGRFSKETCGSTIELFGAAFRRDFVRNGDVSLTFKKLP